MESEKYAVSSPLLKLTAANRLTGTPLNKRRTVNVIYSRRRNSGAYKKFFQVHDEKDSQYLVIHSYVR